MLVNHTCQHSLRRTLGHTLLGALVLFGCGESTTNDHDCAANEHCWSGGSTSKGGASFGGDRSTGGIGGKGTNASGAGGASSQAGAHAGGVESAGGSATNGGDQSGGSTSLGGAPEGGAEDGGAGSSAGGEDTGPKRCTDGAFDDDGDPTTVCKAWSRCAPGQYIAKEGTDRRDRVCVICGTGTFSTTQNARECKAWTDCAANTYLTQAGSTTTDQKCSACPTQSAPASSSVCLPAGACLLADGCAPGTVQVAPANGATPAQCTACETGNYCAGGLTPKTPCASGSFDHDADPKTCCSTWGTCAAGNFISKEGTAKTNRECSPCANGSFSQYPNAPKCFPWKECPAGSAVWPQGGIATKGTVTNDAVCADPYYRFGSDAGDGAAAVALDASGNVYVAGSTLGALAGANAGSNDAFIRKLDAHGNVVWTRQFGTTSDDWATGVAVDGNGDVYVGGVTMGALQGSSAGSADGFVRKLDASGTTLWTKQFGGADWESPQALALDGESNVYVAGYVYGSTQASGDAFVQKLDAAGALSWTRRFGGSDEDEAHALAVDKSGNAYVGGYTYGGLVAGADMGHRDAFVRKFDASGATTWTRQFGTPEPDEILAAAVDGHGNVYVTGTTSGTIEGANAGFSDAFVRKFDSSGATTWTREFGTSSSEYVSAVGVDGSGNAYVVGSTDGVLSAANAGETDIFVRKLDGSGATTWTKQVGTAVSEGAQGAAVDSTGNVYVVGYKDDHVNADAIVLYVPAQ